MSGDYDNERKGVLFKNDDKREGKKDPDYRGSATLNGVDYWVSAWVNTSRRDGSKYMALNYTPKEPSQPAADPATASKLSGTSKAEAGFDDDIPF